MRDEEILKCDHFNMVTSPEVDAFERAAADGKYGRNYQNDIQGDTRVHQIPGSSHSVQLELTSTERMAGLTADTLENLTSGQDADAALTFLYVAHLLAPPSGVPTPELANGKIEMDDILLKLGWDPRSTEERRLMHRKIYQYIQFGERAQVIGQRRGQYKDKHTGEVIDTEIRSSPWRILTDEAPVQLSLYPEQEVPVRVELVMSREWTQILSSPQTAQYLPMAERLGMIPGNKASGAWARVIGLALASFWRRNPRESMTGTLKPTRRELLERYPPKSGAVQDILNSTKPLRAIEYWCGAMSILVDGGLLEANDESLMSVADHKRRIPRQGWAEGWMNECIILRPGGLLKDAVSGRAAALPLIPTRRGKGRPKKAK